MNNLPINLDLLRKREEIPVKIAKLSYRNERLAINFIRMWGEKQIAISEIHAELNKNLKGVKS